MKLTCRYWRSLTSTGSMGQVSTWSLLAFFKHEDVMTSVPPPILLSDIYFHHLFQKTLHWVHLHAGETGEVIKHLPNSLMEIRKHVRCKQLTEILPLSKLIYQAPGRSRVSGLSKKALFTITETFNLYSPTTVKDHFYIRKTCQWCGSSDLMLVQLYLVYKDHPCYDSTLF